jgi:hypothetical protein
MHFGTILVWSSEITKLVIIMQFLRLGAFPYFASSLVFDSCRKTCWMPLMELLIFIFKITFILKLVVTLADAEEA